jgi:hypothetical protein
MAKYKRRPSIYSALGYDVVQVLDRAVSSVKGDLALQHNIPLMLFADVDSGELQALYPMRQTVDRL